MGARKLTDSEVLTLEQMIDRTSVAEVVRQISEICFQKAGHILENWQDPRLAKAWNDASKLLEQVSQRDRITAVSK